MWEKIEEVLDEDVRPHLLFHEGGVSIADLHDGILRVKMLGKCSGCPSATLTIEELIAEKVKAKIPEITDVILVNEVSEDLIDIAKKILNHQI